MCGLAGYLRVCRKECHAWRVQAEVQNFIQSSVLNRSCCQTSVPRQVLTGAPKMTAGGSPGGYRKGCLSACQSAL